MHGEPLAYFRGAFGRLERVKELAAYDAVREWVLRRRTPLRHELDPAVIAAETKSDPQNVHNALVKLTAESLVTRGDKGEFLPTPITHELIDSVYDGRAHDRARRAREPLRASSPRRTSRS